MNLTEQKCVPCEIGGEPMKDEEIQLNLANIPTWSLVDGKLFKKLTFKDFKEALVFVNKVGELAESEGHHPDIALSYGSVAITLFTHAVGGLSYNDFILAAKIDVL